MRVLIVDDHRLVVEGLVNLLAAHGIEVVATAYDGSEAVFQARKSHPDVILMDIRMPGCDGLAATRLIKAQMPETKIVMLTASAEDDDLFEAVKSGASGYLLKSASGQEFLESLAGLEQGVPPFSPGLFERILNEFAGRSGGESEAVAAPDRGSSPEVDRASSLTERQTEVLEAVAGGFTYKETGARLGLSERTVRYHMAEMLTRLHLEHRSQVIAYAAEAGLLDTLR